MEKNVNSELKFNTYIVKEIKYKFNDNFEEDKPIKMDFYIKPNFIYDNNVMRVMLNVQIFRNMEKNNFPFTIEIQFEGLFETDAEDKKKFEPNAIAILYPYIRAIVSTYTAQANVNPLILPPINVNKLIEEQK